MSLGTLIFLFELFYSELILLKRILMPKGGTSCSDAKDSGRYSCVTTGFRVFGARFVFRIG